MNARAQRLACCCLLLVACSKDAPKDRTRSEFCEAWAEAACSSETISACQAADADACRKSQETACLARVPDSFSDAMGDACIAAVKKAYADADLKSDELTVVIGLGGPCAAIVRGSKEVGESCASNSDCDASTGFACVTKADDPKGTCQKPEVTQGGRDCSAAQTVCEAGFFCDGHNCIEAKDVGGDCTIPEECGSVGFCNGDGQCEARHKVSATCTLDSECATGVCYEFESTKVCTDRIILTRSEPLCAELR